MSECDDELFGRYCCSRACTAKHDPSSLFCTPHWSLIPEVLQRQVIQTTGAWMKDKTNAKKSAMRNAINAAKVAINLRVAQQDDAARTRR